MNRALSALSQGMLVLGGLLILAGLGWGVWARVNAPPPPTVTAEGAIVLAVTSPALAAPATPEPTAPPLTNTPTPTPFPTEQPRAEGPTPLLLPDWAITPTPMSPSVTPLPPTPTSAPTATPIPPAQEPPTRIVASAIEMDAKVVPMGWEMVDHKGTLTSEWSVPSEAAGWHMNSALPGHGGNVVLSGHHNIEGKVFRYVVELEPGDEIRLYVNDMLYNYTVTEKYILKEAGMPLKVRQRNAQWITPTDDERLTLVTCWPYEWPGNSHRVIVIARLPSYFEAIAEEANDGGAK
jgi:sortase A